MKQGEYEAIAFYNNRDDQHPVMDELPEKWWERIDPRFAPVWEGRTEREKPALALYFLPHKSAKTLLVPTRPRIIKWYCPFAPQHVFRTGHRYCINVYSGCAHECVYCYASAYMPQEAQCKLNFQKMLVKDLADLERFDVPPAPIHLSNSTDPFQPLEDRHGHTKIALEGILAHRHRFTTVTLLTKNPRLAAKREYIQLLKALSEIPLTHPFINCWKTNRQPAVQIEVSMAFWREESRAFWDPKAPSVQERVEGVQALREAGIPLVLRIDPLFPRSPLAQTPSLRLADYGLAEAQTLEDLENLISFAKESGARHVVYSPTKIVQPRRSPMHPILRRLKEVYERISEPEKLIFRGGSWRLPSLISERYVTRPFVEMCQRKGMVAKYCMSNLVETP